MEVLKFLADNQVVLVGLLFLAALFRQQIAMLIPEIVRHKFGIKREEKALPTTTLQETDAENGGAVRSVAYTWPEMSLVGDSDRFKAWVLATTQEQRERRERLTFNMTPVRSINTRFVQGWKAAVLKILNDNAVCVLMIFPRIENRVPQLSELKEYIEEEIEHSGKSSICVREDDRRYDKGPASQTI